MKKIKNFPVVVFKCSTAPIGERLLSVEDIDVKLENLLSFAKIEWISNKFGRVYKYDYKFDYVETDLYIVGEVGKLLDVVSDLFNKEVDIYDGEIWLRPSFTNWNKA